MNIVVVAIYSLNSFHYLNIVSIAGQYSLSLLLNRFNIYLDSLCPFNFARPTKTWLQVNFEFTRLSWSKTVNTDMSWHEHNPTRRGIIKTFMYNLLQHLMTTIFYMFTSYKKSSELRTY